MPPVKDLSKLTKEDLLNKCRDFNLPVRALTKKSRTSLEYKVRIAMNEEHGTKYFGQANDNINSKQAETPKSVRPSRIPVLMRSYTSGGMSPVSRKSIFEDSNDSGIQLSFPSIGKNAYGSQGISTLTQLKNSLMEDLKEFGEKEFEEKEFVEEEFETTDHIQEEEELPVSNQLKRPLKAEYNLNESEDEDKEDAANVENSEEEEKPSILQSKWFSAGLILVTVIILLYIIFVELLYIKFM